MLLYRWCFLLCVHSQMLALDLKQETVFAANCLHRGHSANRAAVGVMPLLKVAS